MGGGDRRRIGRLIGQSEASHEAKGRIRFSWLAVLDPVDAEDTAREGVPCACGGYAGRAGARTHARGCEDTRE